MRDGECSTLVYVISAYPQPEAIVIYTWKAKTQRKPSSRFSDWERCVTWRKNDAIKRGVATEDLRIVGPRIHFGHYLMHSVVPDASIRVIGNIRAMTERRLRREILYTCFGIDKAVRKSADVRRTSLIFYECSTLARVIGGRAWIDPTAGPEGTICIGATFRAIRLRRA